jgi:hypothetical protein
MVVYYTRILVEIQPFDNVTTTERNGISVPNTLQNRLEVTIDYDTQDELVEYAWMRLETDAARSHWSIESLRLAKAYAQMLIVPPHDCGEMACTAALIDAASAVKASEQERTASRKRKYVIAHRVRDRVIEACRYYGIDPHVANIPLIYDHDYRSKPHRQ